MRWKLVTVLVSVTLSALLLPSLTACDGSQLPAIDCSTAEVKGYSEIGDAVAYCTGCHGGSNPRAGISLATYDDAATYADEIAEVVSNGEMPPDGNMPQAQQLELVTWAQCGTPE